LPAQTPLVRPFQSTGDPTFPACPR